MRISRKSVGKDNEILKKNGSFHHLTSWRLVWESNYYYNIRFGRISPTMGFIMPPCVDGCRRSPRPKSKDVQFAIPTAQYFPRHLEPGTSSNLLALALAPLSRIWRKWLLLQLVTRFWTMFSSYLEDNHGNYSFQIHESLKDKNVVLLAVSGVFTPTCMWVAQEFNYWMSSTFLHKLLLVSISSGFRKLVGLFGFKIGQIIVFAASSTCRASSTMLQRSRSRARACLT